MKNRDLLEQIADALERGDLITGFDFNKINIGELETREYHSKVIPNCGTMQCAAGMLPGFTDKAYFDDNGSLWIFLDSRNEIVSPRVLAEFFDISMTAAGHLFYPNQQMPVKYGGKLLDRYATATEVGENIKEFLKKYKK